MNLSLRLLWTLATASRRGPIGPLDSAVTSWRVLPGDVDLYGHMNNGRYLAIMDLARIDFLARLGMLPILLRERWVSPVGAAFVDFTRALRPLERYEVVTRLVAWDDVWFYLRQDFVRPGTSDASGTGYVKTVFRGPGGPLRPAEVLERALGHALPRLDLPGPIAARFGVAAAVAAAPAEAAAAPTSSREPIAIVGIGCRLPGGAARPDELWQLLLDGRDVVVDIPAERWSPERHHDPTGRSPGRAYVQRGGLLAHDLRAFDAGFFGITPREAAVLDPQQRLLLETSWEAFEDAGIPPHELAGSRTGVFIGGFTLDNMLVRMGPYNRDLLGTETAAAITLTMLSNRLSYVYDLRGPSLSIDTACSSSLVALHVACRSLWAGEVSRALVGGVSALIAPETQIMMAKGRFLSPRGRCHSFSAEADGYVRAEGASVVVLEPLSVARRAGHRIYATILGTATNQDGRTHGITVPNADAQIAVMREAYREAGVAPSRVAYVEAHGTGTPVGDPIEARALGAVLGEGRAEALLVGSIKSNMGHLEAAAGVTGLVKAALCLERREVPGNLHFDPPNPNIPFDELGLRVPTGRVALPAAGQLLAGVNSFGYGGSNAHAVLASVEPSPVPPPTRRPPVLPLSARSAPALAALAAAYADHLEAGADLLAVCRSAAVHRTHHRIRRAWAADERTAAVRALREPEAARPPRGAPPRLLFVYTGMGPQWWAMGRELRAAEPVVREAFEECDAVYRAIAGTSILEEMLRDERSSRIARTEIAQPANAVLQIALTRLWASWGVRPDGVLGHSIGEVGAAFAGGALSLRDALTVAHHRSRLQQRLAGRGGMLAIGLSPAETERRLAGWPGVEIAAVNSERAVTLAGERASLARVATALAAEGEFVRALDVEVPYHSAAMDELEGELTAALRGLAPSAGELPIYSTVTGRAGGAQHDAGYWWRNVRAPVRFAAALGAALEHGHDVFLEIGPHPVLASSIHDVLRARGAAGDVIASLRRGRPEPAAMAEALARLYVAGIDPDWAAYCGPGRHVSLPTYPWQREIHWDEAERSRRERHAPPEHPLAMREPHAASPTWVAEINLGRAAYLRDHVVGGAAIFPGAGHVELALAARHDATGSVACSIEDLELVAPVVLSDGAVTRLVVAGASDGAVIRIHARTGEAAPVLCAQAKVYGPGAEPVPVDLVAVAARLRETIDPDVLYGWLSGCGLAYGPGFRAVRSARRGDREVLASLALPDGVDADGYHLHPVLLDAALHSLLAVAADRLVGATVVPVAIDRVHVRGAAGRTAVVHGALRAAGDDRVRGDLVLARSDGTVVAELRGLTCKVIGASREQADARARRLLHARAFAPIEPAADEAVGALVVLGEGAALAPAPRQLAVSSAATATDVERAVARAGELGRPVWLVDLRAAELAAPEVPLGTGHAEALLDTVRALRAGDVDRYVLVTRQAEAVVEDEPRHALHLAATIGLARTIMTERPDLRLTVADLADGDPLDAATLAWLRSLGPEQEVARRAGRTYAARILARAPEVDPGPPLPASDAGAFALEIGEVGQLHSLGFAACARPAPGPGEVEIEVELASLGFKDVMKALGMLGEGIRRNTYFGSGIGMDGVGRVTAIGPGVGDLAIGDRVYAMGRGFLRSHVVTAAGNVHRLPAALPADAACNLINFITAQHALVEVARLAPGERVLIHSASGGVGLAAIEVARACGAEILATAGSEAKREFVRSLGVERVAASRDLSFADDVARWTDGRGVDVVLSFTPGEIVAKNLACLAPFGRFVEIGKMSFEQDAALHLRPFHENLTYAAVDLDRMLASRPDRVRALAITALARIEDGTYRPTPVQTVAASDAADAFRLMTRGQHTGKLCIAMRDPRLTVARPPRSALVADATYLVTGGLGGFGLEIARWLAARGARHLALLGRSGAAGAEARAALAELGRAGVEVRALAADVADPAALDRALRELRAELPPLRGVVHAATVYDDRPLATLDRAALDRVMAGKALGAWNLHRATEADPLDLFVLCSSVSSWIGNAGQGNYVAANAFLDALAVHRRRRGRPGHAVAFGALGQAGAVARDRAVALHLERLGVRGIATADALAALGHALDGGPAQVGVIDADWARLSAALDPRAGRRRLERLVGPASADHPAARPSLADLDDDAAHARIVAALQGIFARVTRAGKREVEASIPLREMGLDSLLALELSAGIESELGVALPMMVIAAGPSLDQLARSVREQARPPTQLAG